MRSQLATLGRNLRAGLRLVLLLRVTRLDFRIGVAQLLLLFAFSALLDIGADWVRYGPDTYFTTLGAGSELFAAGLMLLTSALIALALRQPALTVAIPVLALAGYPPLQLALTLPSALVRWAGLPASLGLWFEWLVLAWAVVLFIRAVAVALAPANPHRWRRAAVAGLFLAAPIWISPLLTPTEPWWQQPRAGEGADPRFPNPASEAVLAAQQQLLDGALTDLEDERAGTTDLYFVGFAGDGQQDVFRKDVQTAKRVMDERWNTGGRSVALINNPRTLLDTPIATVTNLRATLAEIGAAINPDEDVVMVYLASHAGADHVLEVALPPLELAQITPAILRTLLDESGIKWRIVVVSACYAGGFIQALEDEQTVVIAASQADRPSFGCSDRSDATYFGEAFFEQGLAKSDSIPAAFELARKRVAEREAAAGYTPSNPRISIGTTMGAKLKELERGSVARRVGRSL